jgi:hypothetical protein
MPMSKDHTPSPAIEKAGELLVEFLDILLPGGNGWPSASSVGVQHAILMRLAGRHDDRLLTSLADVLMQYGAPYRGLSEAEKVAAVEALEAAEPDLFDWLRSAANYAYYEAPVVVAAINAHGVLIRLDPHREGYDLPPFDVETQSPRHNRGHWIPTQDVRRIDISSLELDTKITHNWGLQR